MDLSVEGLHGSDPGSHHFYFITTLFTSFPVLKVGRPGNIEWYCSKYWGWILLRSLHPTSTEFFQMAVCSLDTHALMLISFTTCHPPLMPQSVPSSLASSSNHTNRNKILGPHQLWAFPNHFSYDTLEKYLCLYWPGEFFYLCIQPCYTFVIDSLFCVPYFYTYVYPSAS